jgi:hypothetical protein
MEHPPASEVINRTWEEHKDSWQAYVRKQHFVDAFMDAGFKPSYAQRALRKAGDRKAISWFIMKNNKQQYYRRNRIVTEDDLR